MTDESFKFIASFVVKFLNSYNPDEPHEFDKIGRIMRILLEDTDYSSQNSLANLVIILDNLCNAITNGKEITL